MERGERFGGGAGPGALGRAGEAAVAQLAAQHGVGRNETHRLRNGVRIGRVDEEGSTGGGLGHAGAVGSDHGRAAGHRLQDGQAEAFEERRVDEGECAAVEGGDLWRGVAAKVGNVAFQSKRGDERIQLGEGGPRRADDLEFRTVRNREQGERPTFLRGSTVPTKTKYGRSCWWAGPSVE